MFHIQIQIQIRWLEQRSWNKNIGDAGRSGG